MKNKLNKITSVFLVVILLLTMLPSSVLAASFGNMTDGALVTVKLTGTAGSVAWDSNLNSMTGYKVSVWYAPI